MANEVPVFDDEWVASAKHHELSVAERHQLMRERRDALRRKDGARQFYVVVGTVVLCAGLVIGVGLLARSNSGDNPFSAQHVAEATTVGGGDRPSLSRGNGTRLLPEVTPQEASTSYAFLATRDDGGPVTYDPCRTIEFVVNPTGAPPRYQDIVQDTLAELSRATGLSLVYAGDTSEVPLNDRPPLQTERYGDRWVPVLIAWTDETVIADLQGDVAGVGGSGYTGQAFGPMWYVTGSAYLDRSLGPDRVPNRAVLLHELGHVLGLDHVADSTQIMNAVAESYRLGAGDLAGLARVGAGDCAGSL